MANFSPLDAYSHGLIGARRDPRADEEFVDSILRHGGNPDGGAVAHEWEFANAGAGKLTLLFPVADEVFPNCLPGPAQLTGDCFPAGTKVRMADGSEKDIESVVEGEAVASHTGAARVVEAVIKKPYKGDLLTVAVKGSPRAITCTPDHRLFAGSDDDAFWCRADLLTKGTRLLLTRHNSQCIEHSFDLQNADLAVVDGRHPRCIPAASTDKVRWKCTKHDVNRHITLDSRLAWLVGLYLAEGSCDRSPKGYPRRITLNLSSKETYLAEYAAALFGEVFGVAAKVCSVPSKPSVLYVRVSSLPVAWLFSLLAPGNTYTKSLNPIFFSATSAVRVAVLRGWFAGDGHIKSRRNGSVLSDANDSVAAVAVSVSGSLVTQMFDIANSCGIASSVTRRKARGRSLAASNLAMYGANAVQMFPGTCSDYRIRKPRTADGKHGLWRPVSSVTREPFEGHVYCLQVADEHSFVANGFAVHNCVAHACSRALLASLAQEIKAGKPDEVTGVVEGAPEMPELGIRQSVIAPESLWAWRGYDSDGWVCSAAAKVACEQGFLVRKPYHDLGIDLTQYTERTIRLGGSKAPGKKWLAESSKYIARTATVLKGREQVRAFLAAGYGVMNCSGMSFDRTRNEDGFSRQTPQGWAHAQSYWGYDDRPDTVQKYGQALVLWCNSWNRWNTGPRTVRGTNIEIPHGCFWTLASTIDRASNIALSSVAGWPRRQHTTFGATGEI